MEISYELKLETNEVSNDFLLILWNNFHKEFGKCAWQYTPTKYGKKRFISFGLIDIGLRKPVSVGIYYRQRGCIKTIVFSFDEIEINDGLKDKFNALIEKSKDEIGHKNTSIYRIPFISIHGIVAEYKGDNFRIIKSKGGGNNIIELVVTGYGENDKRAFIAAKINHILGLFASFTNSVFLLDKELEKEINTTDDKKVNISFNDDKEFLNGISIVDEEILIPKHLIGLIDRVLTSNLSRVDKICIESSVLFHSGRKIDAQILDTIKYGETEKTDENSFQIKIEERNPILTESKKLTLLNSEMSTVLYISALEIVATIKDYEKSRCNECGQLKYSISKRVFDFVKSNINEHIAKFIKENYNARSSFVHSGKLLSNYSYSGNSLPQLDPNSSNGCLTRIQSPSINLREYTSFLIRKSLEENSSQNKE